MNKYMKWLLVTAWMVASSACEDFRDANQADTVASIRANVTLTLAVENVASTQDFVVKFDNYDENLHISEECNGTVTV